MMDAAQVTWVYILIFGFASDSVSICQTQPKRLQILRRQCCLDATQVTQTQPHDEENWFHLENDKRAKSNKIMGMSFKKRMQNEY